MQGDYKVVDELLHVITTFIAMSYHVMLSIISVILPNLLVGYHSPVSESPLTNQ